jgi:tRNA A-37 threonylcarbamoyl transferase component Bud32
MTDPLDRLRAALSDRYAIERELGSGGMATVYLAEDLKHHRKVAVKVLRPDLAAALGPERFLQEIEIAAQLQHPNILALYDSGEADGFLFYVMPYIEGPSLRDKLAKEGELPIGDAVRILRDVVDALTEAHTHGVVHRDIKPENILLRGRHALVTDFGVAKAVSEATGREKLTTAGVALGTPAYMAPEQACADPHLDQRVDIYAVGAVAYELLTGRPVFMGTTPQMILSAHMTEPPQPVTKHRDTVPAALESVVMRCLEKRPADRWQSAEELLPQLEALATPSGGVTPTDTRPMPATAAKRTRTAWIGGTAVLLSIALATTVMLATRGKDPEQGGALPVVPSQLTANPIEMSVSGAAISPDARYLAFTDPRGVHLLTLATNTTRPIPIEDPITPWKVWWYPHTDDLLVLGTDSTGIQSLWSVSMFGGAARKVSSSVMTAAFAPDGGAIAVIRAANTRDQSFREIWLMGPNGENPRLFATAEPEESFWRISWTPVAAAVAVATWETATARRGMRIDLLFVGDGRRRATPVRLVRYFAARVVTPGRAEFSSDVERLDTGGGPGNCRGKGRCPSPVAMDGRQCQGGECYSRLLTNRCAAGT